MVLLLLLVAVTVNNHMKDNVAVQSILQAVSGLVLEILLTLFAVITDGKGGRGGGVDMCYCCSYYIHLVTRMQNVIKTNRDGVDLRKQCG